MICTRECSSAQVFCIDLSAGDTRGACEYRVTLWDGTATVFWKPLCGVRSLIQGVCRVFILLIGHASADRRVQCIDGWIQDDYEVLFDQVYGDPCPLANALHLRCANASTKPTSYVCRCTLLPRLLSAVEILTMPPTLVFFHRFSACTHYQIHHWGKLYIYHPYLSRESWG